MPRRPIGQLRDLPRGPGGSHRRAAVEKAQTPERLARHAIRAPQKKFPWLDRFRLPGFWEWLKGYSRYALTPAPRFPQPASDTIISMGNDCRLAIAGDWGTGTDEAARIAELMTQNVCDYTIHLGDIYYVGDEPSIQENCRGIRQTNGYDPVTWPRGANGTFAMNGNHEAYAKDGAYFTWIRKYLNQSSSCFALYNDYWCIIAVDTSYNSEGIPWIGWLAEERGWSPLMPSCKLPEECMQWLMSDVEP